MSVRAEPDGEALVVTIDRREVRDAINLSGAPPGKVDQLPGT
jgi:hypothetical protein